MKKTYKVKFGSHTSVLIYEYTSAWFQVYIQDYVQLASVDFDKLNDKEREDQFQGILHDIAARKIKIEEYVFLGKKTFDFKVENSEVWSEYPRPEHFSRFIAKKLGKLKNTYTLELRD